jgi:hypothetical protein
MALRRDAERRYAAQNPGLRRRCLHCDAEGSAVPRTDTTRRRWNLCDAYRDIATQRDATRRGRGLCASVGGERSGFPMSTVSTVDEHAGQEHDSGRDDESGRPEISPGADGRGAHLGPIVNAVTNAVMGPRRTLVEALHGGPFLPTGLNAGSPGGSIVRRVQAPSASRHGRSAAARRAVERIVDAAGRNATIDRHGAADLGAACPGRPPVRRVGAVGAAANRHPAAAIRGVQSIVHPTIRNAAAGPASGSTTSGSATAIAAVTNHLRIAGHGDHIGAGSPRALGLLLRLHSRRHQEKCYENQDAELNPILCRSHAASLGVVTPGDEGSPWPRERSRRSQDGMLFFRKLPSIYKVLL